MFQTALYGPIERALFTAFSIAPKDQQRVRSRLSSLRTAGLLGVTTGRGHYLAFTPNELWRMVIGLELTLAGFPPFTILTIIKDMWDSSLLAAFREAERVNRNRERGDSSDQLDQDIHLFLNIDNLATASTVTYGPAHEMRGMLRLLTQPRRSASATIVNLSERLRRFHSAFAAEHDLTEPAVLNPAPRSARKPVRKRKAKRRK